MNVLWRWLAVLGVGVALVAVWPGRALASPKQPATITVQPTDDPGDDNELNAVSCTGTTDCVAVGNTSVDSPSFERSPLALGWDGTSWTPQAIPMPDGTSSVILRGVSCVSDSSCMAVGDETATDPAGDSTELTLTESWDGTSWTILPSPNEPWVSGSYNANTLSAVSCSAANACTAVGDFLLQSHSEPATSDSPLVERWNGSRWKLQTTPALGTDGVLRGVACTAAAACLAVGSDDAGGGEPLAESWSGGAWVQLDTDLPAAFGPGGLQAVSCTATRKCTAVGQSYPSNGSAPLADRWNGTSWTAQAPPPLPGDLNPRLDAVSCPSTTSCTATGTDDAADAPGADRVLGERWNGTKWTAFAGASPGTAFTQPFGISCATTLACEVVGQASSDDETTGTLAEGWFG
jgi:hypothetical protein